MTTRKLWGNRWWGLVAVVGLLGGGCAADEAGRAVGEADRHQSGSGDCLQTSSSPGCDHAGLMQAVCDQSATCCRDRWATHCVELAYREVQPGDHGCIATPGPGCARPDVEECVCVDQGDEYCCTVDWDSVCAEEARTGCGNHCYQEVPSSYGDPEFGDCLQQGPLPGCDHPDLMAAVCARTASCCEDRWSSECVEAAYEEFQPGDHGCVAREGPGCARPDVEDCVCVEQDDEYCCTTNWDEACAKQARGGCGNSCYRELPDWY